MKDYYLFSNEGSNIKIEKDATEYKVSLDNSVARFTKEKLIEQLKAFLKYMEKYGNDGSN